MILEGLLKKLFREKRIEEQVEEPSKDKPLKLLKLAVIGINHYDILRPEAQVLMAEIPQNATHLNFSRAKTEEPEYLQELMLIGIPREDGYYRLISSDDLGEKVVVDIAGLDSFRIMRPQYAIVEDGRYFCIDNVPILDDDYYRESVQAVKDYKEPARNS